MHTLSAMAWKWVNGACSVLYDRIYYCDGDKWWLLQSDILMACKILYMMICDLYNRMLCIIFAWHVVICYCIGLIMPVAWLYIWLYLWCNCIDIYLMYIAYMPHIVLCDNSYYVEYVVLCWIIWFISLVCGFSCVMRYLWAGESTIE